MYTRAHIQFFLLRFHLSTEKPSSAKSVKCWESNKSNSCSKYTGEVPVITFRFLFPVILWFRLLSYTNTGACGTRLLCHIIKLHQSKQLHFFYLRVWYLWLLPCLNLIFLTSVSAVYIVKSHWLKFPSHATVNIICLPVIIWHQYLSFIFSGQKLLVALCLVRTQRDNSPAVQSGKKRITFHLGLPMKQTQSQTNHHYKMLFRTTELNITKMLWIASFRLSDVKKTLLCEVHISW